MEKDKGRIEGNSRNFAGSGLKILCDKLNIGQS